ncbi:MAG: hypothetical protein V1667_02980 [bacterium]
MDSLRHPPSAIRLRRRRMRGNDKENAGMTKRKERDCLPCVATRGRLRFLQAGLQWQFFCHCEKERRRQAEATTKQSPVKITNC